MAKRGRPPKLDAHKRGQVLGVLGVGGSMATAAAAVGCCVRTIYNTIQRDPKFCERVQTARAGHEVKMLKCIDDAATEPRYWRAAAWKLEHVYPDRYRPTPQGMVTLESMQNFVDKLMLTIEDALPDEASFEHVMSHVDRIFAQFAFENCSTAETLLDHPAADPDEPLPADAA